MNQKHEHSKLEKCVLQFQRCSEAPLTTFATAVTSPRQHGLVSWLIPALHMLRRIGAGEEPRGNAGEPLACVLKLSVRLR